MDRSARRSLLLDAIDTALKALATLPQDVKVAQLIAVAQRLRRQVAAWGEPAPSEDEMTRVEQHVWSLHMAVADTRRREGE